jgi:hypothetical protein
LLLAACSTADDVVFKTLAGEAPGERGTIPPNVASGPVGVGPPALGPTRFRKDRPIGRTAARKPTRKSALGGAAAALARRHGALEAQVFRQDDELQRIRRSIKLHHTAYLKAIEGFGLAKDKRLPEDDAAYRANMREARSRLGRLNGDLLKLNALAARINATATQTTQLLTAVRAAGARARGAEARRALKALAETAGRTDALPPKMLAEIQSDIASQGAYAQNQNRGLDVLAEAVGQNTSKPKTRIRQLEAPSIAEAIRSGARPPAAGGAAAARARRSARPLVRIRFTKPDVEYKPALYRALQAALKQRPDLAFEVVGVAPSEAGQAGVLSRAQAVMFAMADMGVPPDRVTVSTETSRAATTDEVRIFVR